MNYSRFELHNQDRLPYSFQIIFEGFQSGSTIDSKDTTPLLYSHRATSFEHEGFKSLAQGDTPGIGSGV
jgi:hypothetical protein